MTIAGRIIILTLTALLAHAQNPAAPAPLVAPATPDELARDAFKKGVSQFQEKKFDEARATLAQVPELGGYLSLYKHWFLGQTLVELAKYKEAEPEVAKVIQSQASAEMKYQAQFLWGEIALREKRYGEAISRLTPLERKWRHSYRYPEVLYRLLAAELRLGHIANACKRARRLYTKYPAHALVIGWGSNLQAVEIEGKKMPCKLEPSDFSERIRSLQWAGESEKAHKEIVDLMGKASESRRRELDMILATFLVNEGSVDDALNLLIRYFPQEKSDMKYLMLLGRAAARSGEYQTAVGAFERAYQLSPKSKKGREALYQAAYMSYQFQDYDGAVRKFQEFAKANPRSGLAKDAQWHLAWLQYLRNDYKGALEKFEAVAAGAKSKRKKSDSLQERLLYWTGMAHIRLNELAEARASFEQIIAKNAYSYYGLAAQARLDGVLAQLAEAKKRLPASVEQKPAPLALTSPSTAPLGIAAVGSSPSALTLAAQAAEEEKESEEDLATDSGDEVGDSGDEADEEEGMRPSDFKDPVMRMRIDVANKLIQMGLQDLALWELREVERHTRNPQYLRSLINAYEGIGSYYRSAAIADLNFGKERESGGFEIARNLWLNAYPEAYRASVLKHAKAFNVAPEWVWSIMRTESMYKPDVISPVGAKGLMQLMQYTAKNLSKLSGESEDGINLLDTDTNIRLGTQYLARLGAKFKGQLPLVAAAYNAGPHRVESWLVNFGYLEMDEFVEHIPFMETRNYVKKVVRYNTFYRRLYSKDEKSVEYLAKALGVPIPSRASTRETWDSL